MNSLTDGMSMDSFSDSEADAEFPISKKLLKDKLGIHPMLKKSKKVCTTNIYNQIREAGLIKSQLCTFEAIRAKWAEGWKVLGPP